MLIPVRCYTCNKVVGNKQETYEKLTAEGKPQEEIMNILGLKRYCCKRMLLTHVDLIDKMLQYCDIEEKTD
jgi:DNA-directed RNA polymerase I, II, and III subunit RPABC5|tara:strand:+ start:1458 stop:1670 length:213 start_codon:yes stop_codon:yes gene_type:complete